MVKMMNDEFKIMNLRSAICDLRLRGRYRFLALGVAIALSLTIYNSPFIIAFAQQPQAPAGTPLYAANAKYVNGMAPGYWATAGSGLTLNVSAGTAYCGNPPAPVSYPGGSLTLTASATNYIYLDPANNCAPAAGTSAFTAGAVPVATVVTGASSITSVTDARTWFTPQPCVTGSGGSLNCSSAGANQNITLTPSGTGASVITNLQDKGGQVFNVKAYGAMGDGTTNDSPAFQATYNAAVAAGGGTVLIPQSASCYLLNTAINMTGSGTTRGVTIQGVSQKTYGLGSGSAGVICGNTGGIVFDVSGSTEISFRNVSVTSQSGVTNPSLIGIYAARDSAGAGGQNIKATDCVFNMVLHSSGSTYSFGAYLYGSEDDYFSRNWFQADIGLVSSATNDFSQNSAFITESTGAQSNTQNSFWDTEVASSGLGPAVYLGGAGDINLTGHSWNFNSSNPYSGSLYGYALEFHGSNNQLFVKWRQEHYPSFAYVQISLANSLIIGTSAPGGTPPGHGVEFGDASGQFRNDDFMIADSYSAPASSYFYDASTGSPTGVAVLDNVKFSCGEETNCINIPIGNYTAGGTLTPYVSRLSWTASATNPTPAVTTSTAGQLIKIPNVLGAIRYGSGAPTGTCVTPSLYLRTDGGTGSTLYVCESGAWAAK